MRFTVPPAVLVGLRLCQRPKIPKMDGGMRREEAQVGGATDGMQQGAVQESDGVDKRTTPAPVTPRVNPTGDFQLDCLDADAQDENLSAVAGMSPPPNDIFGDPLPSARSDGSGTDRLASQSRSRASRRRRRRGSERGSSCASSTGEFSRNNHDPFERTEPNCGKGSDTDDSAKDRRSAGRPAHAARQSLPPASRGRHRRGSENSSSSHSPQMAATPAEGLGGRSANSFSVRGESSDSKLSHSHIVKPRAINLLIRQKLKQQILDGTKTIEARVLTTQLANCKTGQPIVLRYGGRLAYPRISGVVESFEIYRGLRPMLEKIGTAILPGVDGIEEQMKTMLGFGPRYTEEAEYSYCVF